MRLLKDVRVICILSDFTVLEQGTNRYFVHDGDLFPVVLEVGLFEVKVMSPGPL